MLSGGTVSGGAVPAALCRDLYLDFSYLVLHKIHCDAATNVRRLPRFVIVPCTCVSFVVADILVQIKTSSTQ